MAEKIKIRIALSTDPEQKIALEEAEKKLAGMTNELLKHECVINTLKSLPKTTPWFNLIPTNAFLPFVFTGEVEGLYTGPAWKHHVAEDFEQNRIPTSPNGAGKGGTIFLNKEKMKRYLGTTENRWYIAELELVNEPLLFNFDNHWMATVQRDIPSKEGFKPL